MSEREELPEGRMVRPVCIVVPAALGETALLRKLVAQVQAVCEEATQAMAGQTDLPLTAATPP